MIAPLKPGDVQYCRSCKAQVVFAVNESGRRQIIDADPSDKGNLRLYRGHQPELRVRFVGKEADQPLYIDHHATCPEAKDWRNR